MHTHIYTYIYINICIAAFGTGNVKTSAHENVVHSGALGTNSGSTRSGFYYGNKLNGKHRGVGSVTYGIIIGIGVFGLNCQTRRIGR